MINKSNLSVLSGFEMTLLKQWVQAKLTIIAVPDPKRRCGARNKKNHWDSFCGFQVKVHIITW